MSLSHGDLFSEIGKLVLAANSGEAIDLGAKSQELAKRYRGLGLSEAMLARAISRSIGAIGLSMAALSNGERLSTLAVGEAGPAGPAPDQSEKSATTLFPSGVRLAVLS
jgi:hypothetical protein